MERLEEISLQGLVVQNVPSGLVSDQVVFRSQVLV